MLRSRLLGLGLLALLVLTPGCLVGGTVQCRRLDVALLDHPSKPRPAARVTATCDGKVVLDATGEDVP